MNIGCIYTVECQFLDEKPLVSQESIPFGLALVATCLKAAGHNPEVLVLTPHNNPESVINNYIDRCNPELFCLTAVSSQFPFIVKIAQIIKRKDPRSFILIGGVHATLNPETTILEPCIDAVCIGEGERAVVDLADQIANGEPPSRINNLWIKDQQGIERNSISEFIRELDAIPFIDRSLWAPFIADMKHRPSILIGRGCPNRCTYCCNHALAKISPGKYVRYRSPKNIVEEIELILQDNPGIDEFYLESETLSVNLDYTFHLLKELEEFNATRQKKIRFGTNISMVRQLADNAEFLQSLKRANVTSLNIGLESGSERLRREVLRRPSYRNEDIIAFCRMAEQRGISVNLYVMMGLPGETLSDYDETIRCVKKCAPVFVYLSIFFPYPGTDLYQRAKDLGLFDEFIPLTDSERNQPVLDLPGFSKKRIRMEYILFYAKSLYGVYPFSRIVKLTLGNLFSPYPDLIRIIRRIFFAMGRECVIGY